MSGSGGAATTVGSELGAKFVAFAIAGTRTVVEMAFRKSLRFTFSIVILFDCRGRVSGGMRLAVALQATVNPTQDLVA